MWNNFKWVATLKALNAAALVAKFKIYRGFYDFFWFAFGGNFTGHSLTKSVNDRLH